MNNKTNVPFYLVCLLHFSCVASYALIDITPGIINDYLVGRIILSPEEQEAADVNDDQNVDVADIISMINAAPCLEMVSVPAGTFVMGRRDVGDDESYGGSDELPRHDVTLSAYKIGKYEVTNGQYCDVLNCARVRRLGNQQLRQIAPQPPYLFRISPYHHALFNIQSAGSSYPGPSVDDMFDNTEPTGAYI